MHETKTLIWLFSWHVLILRMNLGKYLVDIDMSNMYVKMFWVSSIEFECSFRYFKKSTLSSVLFIERKKQVEKHLLFYDMIYKNIDSNAIFINCKHICLYL